MEPNRVIDRLSIVFKAAMLTMVIIVTYFAGHTLGALLMFKYNYVSGLWCAVTAIVVFDDFPTNSKTLLRDRLLGTLVGAVGAGASIALLGHRMMAVWLSLFVVTVVVTFFKWNGAMKITCITVLIVHFTTQQFTNADMWITSGMRFLEGVVGGSISLLATIGLDKARQYGLFFAQTDKSVESAG